MTRTARFCRVRASDGAAGVTTAGAAMMLKPSRLRADLDLKFEKPHATVTVRASDKTWTRRAPTSRMISRGATQSAVAVGNDISAYGYPSTVEKDEMRAERITINGKTYEMR